MQSNDTTFRTQAEVRPLVAKAHRAKRRAATSTANAKLVLTLYLNYNGICQLCGEHVPPADVSLDHIIPIARGGDDTVANLQLTHYHCNRSKGTKTTDEWILGSWRYKLRPQRRRNEYARRTSQRVRALVDLAKKVGVADAIPNTPEPNTIPTGLRDWREISALTPNEALAYLNRWREDIKERVAAIGKFDKKSMLLEQAAYWARLRNIK